jgi:predicted nucleic acid-binding protein
VIAVDSSVVVAACASWHESHEVARRAVDRGVRLVAHAALEAYSVLTRLPPPHRVTGALAAALLEERFEDDPLALTPGDLRALPRRLNDLGLFGGAAYDALVALSAAAHGAVLLTLDRRAEATYRKCGARYRLLAGA